MLSKPLKYWEKSKNLIVCPDKVDVVFPAKAGIHPQCKLDTTLEMDPHLRGDDRPAHQDNLKLINNQHDQACVETE